MCFTSHESTIWAFGFKLFKVGKNMSFKITNKKNANENIKKGLNVNFIIYVPFIYTRYKTCDAINNKKNLGSLCDFSKHQSFCWDWVKVFENLVKINWIECFWFKQFFFLFSFSLLFIFWMIVCDLWWVMMYGEQL